MPFAFCQYTVSFCLNNFKRRVHWHLLEWRWCWARYQVWTRPHHSWSPMPLREGQGSP
jgi:hypothetical protein